MNLKRIVTAILILTTNFLFAQELSKEQALSLIKQNASALNINLNEQLPVITNAYTDPQTKLAFIYFQQQYKSIKIYNQIISATFKDGALVNNTGHLLNKLENIAPSEVPVITALQGAKIALADLKLKGNVAEVKNDFVQSKKYEFSAPATCRRNIKAELLWLPNDIGTLNLVWDVQTAPLNSVDYWFIKVDALSGKIISKRNNIINELSNKPVAKPFAKKINTLIKKNIKSAKRNPPPATVNASYKVVAFPNTSPWQNGITTETNPWLKAGAGNNAITAGWHNDSANDYDYTRGNNVYAYDDSAAVHFPGRPAPSLTPYPNLSFNYILNNSTRIRTDNNRNAAITDLFYWNNLMHDVFYQYGFNEVSGNFQMSNFGRGGLGKDGVYAEGQSGEGLSNAYFSPMPDGDSSFMVMFLFPQKTTQLFYINSPYKYAQAFTSKEGSVSINNLLANVGGVTASLALYKDNAATTNNACVAASNALTGKIAVIQYSNTPNCSYAVRIKNAQNAGAIGVVVISTTGTPATMSGSDNTIIIPAVSISNVDGLNLINALNANENIAATLKTPDYYDGDFESGIICHEYGHGISNRLTGGSATVSCLDNNEQAGEGWSDYFALMMTTNWQTAKLSDDTISRPLGNYVLGLPYNGKGIRTRPYTTNFAINNLTYGKIAQSSDPHFYGEVWCAAIWDMTWEIIKQENFIEPNLYNAGTNGGNVIALNLVMLGLKLQPCSPGFLDSRDAILAADDILYNGKHKCAIWRAFARRGMGYSAVQGSSNSVTDQVEAMDLPGSVVFAKPKDLYKILPSNSSTSFTVKTSSQCNVPVNGYKVKAVVTSDFAITAGTGGVANADSVIYANRNFIKEFQVDSISVAVKAIAAGCNIDSVVYDNRDNRLTGGFTNVKISGNNSWVTSSLYSYSPVKSWQSADITTVSNTALKSNNFLVKPVSLLSFWHRYDYENGYDGGLVEVSDNNGSTWQTIEDKNILNGYTVQMSATSALPGLYAYTGLSSTFKNSIFNLSSFKNNTLGVRFRSATDNANGGGPAQDGWNVDDIIVANGCGNQVRFYLYDNTNKLLDSISIPVFITPVIVPVTLVAFKAVAKNNTAYLQWQIANEENIKNYTVERSDDRMNWKEIGKVIAVKSKQYSFTDEYPGNNIIYYRLKPVEINGTVTYSNIEQVIFKANKSIQILPNPAKNEVRIYINGYNETLQVVVSEISGKSLMQKSFNGSDNIIELNTSVLTSGSYLVNVYNKNERVYTEKLLIVK